MKDELHPNVRKLMEEEQARQEQGQKPGWRLMPSFDGWNVWAAVLYLTTAAGIHWSQVPGLGDLVMTADGPLKDHPEADIEPYQGSPACVMNLGAERTYLLPFGTQNNPHTWRLPLAVLLSQRLIDAETLNAKGIIDRILAGFNDWLELQGMPTQDWSDFTAALRLVEDLRNPVMHHGPTATWTPLGLETPVRLDFFHVPSAYRAYVDRGYVPGRVVLTAPEQPPALANFSGMVSRDDLEKIRAALSPQREFLLAEGLYRRNGDGSVTVATLTHYEDRGKLITEQTYPAARVWEIHRGMDQRDGAGFWAQPLEVPNVAAPEAQDTPYQFGPDCCPPDQPAEPQYTGKGIEAFGIEWTPGETLIGPEVTVSVPRRGVALTPMGNDLDGERTEPGTLPRGEVNGSLPDGVDTCTEPHRCGSPDAGPCNGYPWPDQSPSTEQPAPLEQPDTDADRATR